MKRPAIEGVVPILVTPFDEEGQIDTTSLESLVEHNIAAGVHGLGIAIGSEIFKLTEPERFRLGELVVSFVKGRVPVVINTGAPGTDMAVHYSQMAEAAGADALMVMPPYFLPVGGAEIADYYRRIAESVSLPIILQDIVQAPVPPAMALQLAGDHPNIAYIKVETQPVPTKVAEMAAAVGDRLTVFGGAGGGYFIEELRRGARGTMPFATQPGAYVEVWDRFNAGDEGGARQVFDGAFAAVNRVAMQNNDLFFHVHKQMLMRQGVIRTAYVRSPTVAIDDITQREIDEVVRAVVPERVAYEPARATAGS